MKILTLENYDLLQPYIEQADYNEYNSNSITMMMWSSMYEVHFEIFERFAIAYTKMPHRDPVWLMPYCKKQYRKDAVLEIKKYSKKLNIPFEIHSMTVEFKNWLFDAFPQEFLVWDCFDAQDYIYDRRQQETLSGKKMQKRRNHYNAFLKQYSGRFQYKTLEQSDIQNVYAFLSYWQSQKEQHESIHAEVAGIHLLLSNIDKLPISGGCIYIDGKLEAFTITSKLSKNTVQIHVEKANRNIRGLYIAILKLFLETQSDDILYVNREDDMGLVDLRKAKSDMQPIHKIKKFACCYEAIEIRKAKEEDTTDIKQLWAQSFKEETEQSTAYYFQHLFHKEDCYILCSKNDFISMVQVRKMNLMIEKQKQQVSFIVGVATNEEYEGCGYMKLLLHHVLSIVSKVEPFTLLQAYDWNIYTPFGFEEVYKKSRTKLDKQFYTEPYGKLYSCDEASILLKLYNIYTSDKNGYRIRDIAYYDTYFLPYKKLWQQSIVVHEQDNNDVGYMVLSYEEDGLHILECIYTNEQQLKAMLSLLCDKAEKIYVHIDIYTILHGRRKEVTCMMVKEHGNHHLVKDNLYINEEL